MLNIQMSWKRFFLLLQNTWLGCSQSCFEVLASHDIEALFSTCFWVRLVKQLQFSTNTIWSLFDQHTQVYIAFVFIIIKTLWRIRMGSTKCIFHIRLYLSISSGISKFQLVSSRAFWGLMGSMWTQMQRKYINFN